MATLTQAMHPSAETKRKILYSTLGIVLNGKCGAVRLELGMAQHSCNLYYRWTFTSVPRFCPTKV